MPKNKTHSGAKKRFRITAGGKIMRQRANHVHKFHEKSPQHARRLANDVVVAAADTKVVKRLLGK
ncbi:MAG: 50S ribosomal protein L35 [Dermatophilaceae bacterium]